MCGYFWSLDEKRDVEWAPFSGGGCCAAWLSGTLPLFPLSFPFLLPGPLFPLPSSIYGYQATTINPQKSRRGLCRNLKRNDQNLLLLLKLAKKERLIQKEEKQLRRENSRGKETNGYETCSLPVTNHACINGTLLQSLGIYEWIVVYFSSYIIFLASVI